MQGSLGLLLLLIAQGLAAETVNVTAQPLAELLQPRQLDAPAQVEALNAPRLSAEIQARIIAIPVRVGDSVLAGDLLVEMDCSTYDRQLAIAQASIARSQASLVFARSQLQRAENLQRNKSISEELFDQRRAELAIAKADLLTSEQQAELAQRDQDNCRVRAPFDAVVTERLASEGDYATPGQALVMLTETSRLEVSAKLREAEIQALSAGNSYRFVIDGQSYPLTLERTVPVLDPAALTAEVRLVFATELAAKPGAAGRLQWQAPTSQLPASLLIRRDGKLGVFVADAGRAVFKSLPDAVEGRPFMPDLPADSMLVIDGRQRLQPGDALTVDETAPGSGPDPGPGLTP